MNKQKANKVFVDVSSIFLDHFQDFISNNLDFQKNLDSKDLDNFKWNLENVKKLWRNVIFFTMVFIWNLKSKIIDKLGFIESLLFNANYIDNGHK